MISIDADTVAPKISSGKSRRDPIDSHVGSRVRLRRTLLGMSQEKLGQAVGITFQQIQKYERGLNRIGSSRLYQFGQVLDVPVSYFFENLPSDGASASQTGLAEPGTAPPPMEDDNFSRRETLELVRAFYRIGDRNTRRRIYELIKAVAGEPVNGPEST
jgi:transcriptional regulator with XRE-family HTH domain